jgi:hypothetical protein
VAESITVFGQTLSLDDLIAFSKEVTPQARCPACGGHQWEAIIAPPSEGHVIVIGTAKLLPDHTIDSTGANAIMVGLFMCMTCGFIRHCALHKVAEWKQGRQA